MCLFSNEKWLDTAPVTSIINFPPNNFLARVQNILRSALVKDLEKLITKGWGLKGYT